MCCHDNLAALFPCGGVSGSLKQPTWTSCSLLLWTQTQLCWHWFSSCVCTQASWWHLIVKINPSPCEEGDADPSNFAQCICQDTDRRHSPSTSFYIPIVLYRGKHCSSSPGLWAAVFSAPSGCDEGLTVGIFLDAECFRSSSVVQKVNLENRSETSCWQWSTISRIFRACEVRLAASEGFRQNLNGAKS